jgi:hypothetical protein
LFDVGLDGWEGAMWYIHDIDGILANSGTMVSGDYIREDLCMPEGCYIFSVDNGTDPSEISWTATGGGFGMISGGAGGGFDFSLGNSVCGCTDPAACNYDPTATDDNGTCCLASCATVFVGGGNADSEISWEILDGGSNVIYSGGANSQDPDVVCLDGCYTLNLYDSGGNGWEGALIMIEDQDATILFAGSLSGFASSGTFNVCSDYPLDFQCVDVDPPGCPSIYAGEDIINSCMDPCVDLEATVFETGETNSYAVESIPYAPVIPYEDGVQVSIGIDDIWSYEIPLPFDFCFFGNSYTRMLVGSNALVTFHATDPLGWCEWEFTQQIPDPILQPLAISGPYHDIDPSVCGSVTYSICGESPCRFAVINYHDVCHYQCNEIMSSCQIVIYETTNVVEVYIEDKPTCATWNDGNAVIGLQDATGGTGVVAPSRQTGDWTASNEAWRFVPDGTPNYEVSWYHGSTFIGSGVTLPICAVESPNVYRAEAVYTNCNGDEVTVSDEVVIQCSFAILPIELLSFEAEVVHGDVVCYWSTASETDNDYFTVERSIDGVEWEKVGTVDGAGTSLDVRNYSFWDHDPYPGVSYYRLQQTDFNGDFDHSELRAVEIEEDFGFVVFPNPNSGTFFIKYTPVIKEIRIRDIQGRLINFEMLGPAEISMLSAAQGTYIIEMITSSGEILLRERFMVN